jgi:hypothetical protein
MGVTLGLLRAEQPELSDATAIAASLDAPSAFSPVFERHHAAVHRYLARRLGRDLADELAAETFAVGCSESQLASPSAIGAARSVS